MGFKAKLKAIQQQAVNNDTVNVEITFYDVAKGKSFTRSFNWHASNFPNKAAVKQFLKAQCDELDTFEQMQGLISPFVGQDDLVALL